MRALVAVALAFALTLAVAGCGGGEEVSPEPETVIGTIEQETVGEGNAQAGKQVFAEAQPSCGGCHALQAAGSSGTTGPNLDESLGDDDPQSIHDDIVNPSAEVEEGYPDVMPKDYGETLSEKQLNDLVAFLAEQGG